MKYLKGFKQINESHQDGLEIMDAIQNSPEGKDLCKILGIDVNLATEIFDLKKTGRIYLLGAGSKTYIEKNSNYYYFISISQGKYFGEESFPTIKELLRALWSNILGKQLTYLGIKKEDLRNWVENNIAPGSQLSKKEILDRFLTSNNKRLPDLSLIPQSRVFKILDAFFDVKYELYSQTDIYILSFPFTRIFDINLCSPLSNYDFNNTIYIRPKLKCDNKSNDNHTDIDLCYSDNFLNDFDKILLKKLESSYERIKGLWLESECLKNYLSPLIQSIISMAKDENYGNVLNQENIIVDTIENTIKNNPIDFRKIISALEKSGKFPDIVNKYKKEKEGLIKGGSVLGRFGLDL
jgi:hypothetical protein